MRTTYNTPGYAAWHPVRLPPHYDTPPIAVCVVQKDKQLVSYNRKERRRKQREVGQFIRLRYVCIHGAPGHLLTNPPHSSSTAVHQHSTSGFIDQGATSTNMSTGRRLPAAALSTLFFAMQAGAFRFGVNTAGVSGRHKRKRDVITWYM